jgi:glycosyltransferase involved in cell wall biosynthesis
MSLNIDFSGDQQEENDQGVSPKAMGGTELSRKWLFDRLDPELRDYFQFISSRKRKLEDKPRLFWVHDLAQDPEVAFLKEKSNAMLDFEKILFVSHWQQYQYGVYLGVPYDHGVTIQHAIDPIPEHKKPEDKITCIYFSTPHRGLEVLLESWRLMKENLKSEAVDKAELKVFSSFEIYDRPHMDEQFRHVYKKAQDMDQVHYSGSVSNDVIREELQKTHILAYPSTYMETACICAIEAMSAKQLVVCPNLGALPETCANFSFMYGYEPNPDRHCQVHAHILARAINSYGDTGTQALLDLQKGYFDMFYDWRTRLNQWQAFLTSLMENIEAAKKK